MASPDSIIESQTSLAKLIPAKLHYVPFEAGVTAIAEMKSGAVQAISGVGNPPLTEAIGSGTGVTVVMDWGFDDDQLLVPDSVTSPPSWPASRWACSSAPPRITSCWATSRCST